MSYKKIGLLVAVSACLLAGSLSAAPKKILIIPAGSIDRGVVSEVKSAVERAFNRGADIGAEIRMPSEAHDNYRRQYSTSMILSAMEGYDLGRQIGQSERYERMLVVTDADLFSPGLKYVFGEANPGNGRAVMSVTRLKEEFYNRPADRSLLYERAAKEAIHELGHTYGMGHCNDRSCVMFFSTELKDTDLKEKTFCPACEKKLRALTKGTY